MSVTHLHARLLFHFSQKGFGNSNGAPAFFAGGDLADATGTTSFFATTSFSSVKPRFLRASIFARDAAAFAASAAFAFAYAESSPA